MSGAPKKYQDTWLILPLYNEAAVIGDVVESAHESFPNVVCVDDGSSDDSSRIAEDAGATVIRHPFNLGQGAALQTGIDFALRQCGMRYLVTFDADGQHRVQDAAAMVDRARQDDLAIVFGSRFLSGSPDVGLMRRMILRTAAWVTQMKTGLELTDAHNGLRTLRRDAAQSLDLTQDRMAHASQIVSQLARTGLPWAEQSVTIDYTDYSRAKGQSLLNSINILFDLVMR